MNIGRGGALPLLLLPLVVITCLVSCGGSSSPGNTSCGPDLPPGWQCPSPSPSSGVQSPPPAQCSPASGRAVFSASGAGGNLPTLSGSFALAPGFCSFSVAWSVYGGGVFTIVVDAIRRDGSATLVGRAQDLGTSGGSHGVITIAARDVPADTASYRLTTSAEGPAYCVPGRPPSPGQFVPPGSRCTAWSVTVYD